MIDIVEPHKGNLHGFIALENFAFIDVLIPHYDFDNNHPNFYEIVDIDEKYCSIRI